MSQNLSQCPVNSSVFQFSLYFYVISMRCEFVYGEFMMMTTQKLCTTALLSLIMLNNALADWTLYKGIDEVQKRVIVKDQKNIQALDMPGETSAGFAKIFGSAELTGKTLETFINDRVKVIVNDTFDFESNVTIEGSIPDQNVKSIRDQSAGTVVMSNIGSALYAQVKQYGIIAALSVEAVEGVEKIIVNSPRIGVLEIGPGLFMGTDKEDELNNYTLSLLRISTFAHEGRHSDGAGTNLAFGHNKCPAGHALANEYACDFNGNGPYAVGGILSWELAKNCPTEKCSEKEKLRLKADALDSFSRIMKVNGVLSFPSAAYEEIKI